MAQRLKTIIKLKYYFFVHRLQIRADSLIVHQNINVLRSNLCISGISDLWNMFFHTKKIRLETLPEYLKETRLGLKFSLEEASKKAGMGAKTLKALEEGAYNLLPSGVYVKGFLARLGQLYNVNVDILTRQYEVERSILRNLKATPANLTKKRPGWLEDFVITPKSLSFFGAAIFVSATLVYIVWQVLSISRVPLLEIESPEDFTVYNTSFAPILGRTSPGATVTINHEPVFVDQQGRFQGQLGVSVGPKEITVEAKNRFNKTTSKTLTIIGQTASPIANQISVRMELEILADVEITLQIDGASEVKQIFRAGEKKLAEAQRQILLSASNVGNIRVKINGKTLGLLGRPGEVLTAIPFFAESGNSR